MIRYIYIPICGLYLEYIIMKSNRHRCDLTACSIMQKSKWLFIDLYYDILLTLGFIIQHSYICILWLITRCTWYARIKLCIYFCEDMWINIYAHICTNLWNIIIFLYVNLGTFIYRSYRLPLIYIELYRLCFSKCGVVKKC